MMKRILPVLVFVLVVGLAVWWVNPQAIDSLQMRNNAQQMDKKTNGEASGLAKVETNGEQEGAGAPATNPLSGNKKGGLPPGFSNMADFVNRGLRDPERLDEEKAFEQNGRKLVILPGVVALSPEDQGSEEKMSGAFQHLGFSVLRTDHRAFLEKGLPVVYDPRSGTLGVVTGHLNVKYQQKNQADRLASQYRLKLAQDFPEISLAIFTIQSRSVETLLEVAESIRKDGDVEDVTLDIIENAAHTY